MTIGPADLIAAREELDRVLHSDAFRNSDALRHLLAYLGEKSLASPPVELKEYTIGTEACGKPATYDPQRDASVRVQVGRLRQKLIDYYAAEGAANPVVLELPKGRFAIVPRIRESKPVPQPSLSRFAVTAWSRVRRLRTATLILTALLIAAVAANLLLWLRLRAYDQRLNLSGQEQVMRDFAPLWGPFLSHATPAVAIFGSPGFFASARHPLFVRLYDQRDPDDPKSSPEFDSVTSMLGPLTGPRFDYASMGDAVAAQRLTAFFASAGISLKGSPAHLAAWGSIADSNLIFIGASRMHPLLRRLPIAHDFELGPDDQFHNRRPLPGEPAVYTTPSHRNSMTYAVIALHPGLKPGREVFLLTAHSSPGAIAAAEYVTGRGSVQLIQQRLGLTPGAPRKYFQMLLRVYVDNDVPVKAEYVTHHWNP